LPLVSILIPAIRATWLDETIRSALTQTFTDIEIIVGDDSADDTIEKTVSAWRDPRIKYFKNPMRGTLGSNRDLVLGQARGEYIKFLFDDDFLYPHSVEMLLTMLRGSDCKLAFHSRRTVDADGRTIREDRFQFSPGRRNFLAKFASKIQKGLKSQVLEDEASYGSDDFCIVPPQYFFENMIAPAANLIGEPSNILFHAPTFREMKNPYTLAGNRLRFLGDVALYTSFVSRGHGVIGTSKIGSAFRVHGQQTSSHAYPGYSAGLFEWEFFARWAVDSGHLSLERFSATRPRLLRMYRQLAEKYPELDEFIALPEARPGSPLLDSDFWQTLSHAYDAIDRRKAQLQGGGIF
jgi:hypothetical protein